MKQGTKGLGHGAEFYFDSLTNFFAVLGFLGVLVVWRAFFVLISFESHPMDDSAAASSTFQSKGVVATPSVSLVISPTDEQVIQNMAKYLAQNPSAAISAVQLFDIDLDDPKEFLPENQEKLAFRMTQLAAERPAELVNEFKKSFSALLSNHAEARGRLLKLASYVGDTPSGDSVKEIVLQQASFFIPSQNKADTTFGRDALQTYLDMEKDPVKRKLGAGRVTSIFVEQNSL